MTWKVVGIWTLVAVLAVLSYLTISNQLENNRINAQIAKQSQQGQMARDRQLRVFPVSCKEHKDAWKRGVITYRELTDVWGCPDP